MTHRAVEAADEAPSRDRVFEWGVGLLRLAVPSAWGGAVAWAGTHGLHLPDLVVTGIQWGLMVATSAGWYAAWHAIEAKLPPWATRLVLGSNTAPRYPV